MHIELQNINKSFGDVHANNNINLTFGAGRIIGILGENGAGKSTLMKILSGYQPADSGNILMDGQRVDYRTPKTAIAHGIGMLQQDPLDVGAFTVLENFVYGKTSNNILRQIIYSKAQARRDLGATCQRVGFDLPHDKPITELSIAQRQQLEIVRLLSQNVTTLILDEPTTGISAEQKEQLFSTLKNLAHDDNMTILLVSHKLEDVIALCDDVAILRAGEVVAQKPRPFTKPELVTMMFGHELEIASRQRTDFSSAPTVLELSKLHIQQGRLHMQNIDLQVHQGEVIGFAGLDGSGQDILMRVCAGLLKPDSGHVLYKGADVTYEPYLQLQQSGVFFTASGRIEEGLVAGLTLTEHVALVEDKNVVINYRRAHHSTRTKIDQFTIKGKPQDTIESLSGGNQQRVLLSLIPDAADLLILEQPMRGLDVESAAGIWQTLLARVQQGATIIFSSAELDEILNYSDRIVVCYAGDIFIVDDPTALTVNDLGHLIGGEFDTVKATS